jgi:hypothetical protein
VEATPTETRRPCRTHLRRCGAHAGTDPDPGLREHAPKPRIATGRRGLGANRGSS